MVTNQLVRTPRATSLPMIPELAGSEATTSNTQLDTSSPYQGALESLLKRQETEEQRAAARVGWAHAATNRTNEALLKHFSGRQPEKKAANEGWKTWKMADAHNHGLETFWCEKAPECILDQYLRKDSRPCVSNYFGRNKRNTARIPNMITWCRKHYQRSGYRGRKNPSNNLEWPREKVGLILEQLRRNEVGYFDDTEEHLTYTVSLKKSEQDRLNHHNNHQGKSPEPDPLAKSFEAPVSVLLHIFDSYVGKHRTYEECRALTLWAEAHLNKETCPDLPLWEMLPEYPDFEDLSGHWEEDDDSDEDMWDAEEEDEAAPAKPKKRSRKKTSPRKAILKKTYTMKKTPIRSPLTTRASSAKEDHITEQGSTQKL
jgi:hypothetical protein